MSFYSISNYMKRVHSLKNGAGRQAGLFCLSLLALVLFCTSCEKEPIREIITPTDEYLGNNNLISLVEGCSKYPSDHFIMTLRTASGEKIRRSGKMKFGKGSNAQLHLDYGIADGRYELLNLEYQKEDENGNMRTKRFGLGCSLSFDNGKMTLHSKWNSRMQMFGSGTPVDTLYIASEDHLEQLRQAVNDSFTNEEIDKNYYFLQTDDLDGYMLSEYVSPEYGWMPIGSQQEVPFHSVYDGGGYVIDNLYINRKYMYASALFGFTDGAHIRNVHITNAEIRGDFGVSGLVGIVVSGAGRFTGTFIERCTVSNSTITGARESYGVGGLVGVIDMNTGIVADHCKSLDNSIFASHQAGGVVGAGSRGSTIAVTLCENSSAVKSEYNSAGGIVAVCDTLQAMGCTNRGAVDGSTLFTTANEENIQNCVGTGGIAGGAGPCNFTACMNFGPVNGKSGVGGILGSTRVSGSQPGEAYISNNAVFLNCKNEGAVSGNEYVGGLCGDSQVGCKGSINKGKITATSRYAGGLIGMAPISVVHNNLNKGEVRAYQYAGGIAGVSHCTFMAINQNMGKITAEHSHAAGILGAGSNDVTINYCANFGDVVSDRDAYTSGICAEIGKPEGPLDYVVLVVAGVEVVGSIFDMAFAFINFPEAVAPILSGVSLVWTIATTITEAVFAGLNIDSIISNDEIRSINEENLAELDAIGKQVSEELENNRNAADIDPELLGLPEEYAENLQKLVEHIENEDNYSIFNDNANKAREKRFSDVNTMELAKECIHTCLSGFTTLVSLAAGICATIASGGAAAAAVAFTLVGGVASIVGAGNSMWQTLTTYEQNIVTLDQCIQAGFISAPDQAEGATGGIVAKLNSYGQITDCINIGRGTSAGGHLVGYAGHNSLVKNSLTVAPAGSWGGIYASKEGNADMSGLYYLAEESAARQAIGSMSGATPLTLDELADSGKFQGWDFDSDKGRWSIPKRGNILYPIPYKSRYTVDDQN